MLALSRLVGERIFIGDDIVIEVRKITGARVVIAVGAPDDVVIDREEVFERKCDEDPRCNRSVRESEVLYANR